MFKIIDLKEENPAPFLPFLTRRGQESLYTPEDPVLGALADGKPAGAIAISLADGFAEITSFYVEREYRRLGLGLQLLYQICSDLTIYGGIYILRAVFSDRMEEPSGLKELFTEAGFTFTEDPEHGTLGLLLQDAIDTETLKKQPSSDVVIPYRKAAVAVKNCLLKEHMSLVPFVSENRIEEEISCFIEDDPRKNPDPDCMIFGREDEDLILLWAQSTDNKLDLLKLTGYALGEARKKYEPTRRIRVPYINEVSRKLIMKLFGDAAFPLETVWEAMLPLYLEGTDRSISNASSVGSE